MQFTDETSVRQALKAMPYAKQMTDACKAISEIQSRIDAGEHPEQFRADYDRNVRLHVSAVAAFEQFGEFARKHEDKRESAEIATSALFWFNLGAQYGMHVAEGKE